MKKLGIALLSSLFGLMSFAQTGIGTTTPDASAKLDVEKTVKLTTTFQSKLTIDFGAN